MTKLELAKRTHALLSEAGYKMTQGEVMACVHTVFDVIAERLGEGEDVVISGFGKFSTAKRRARLFHNPKNGEPVERAERTVPSFKAAPKLKASV